MLRKYAQEIAASIAGIVGHSIIITDTEGIVIGANVLERLGSFHEASLSVVETRQREVVDERRAGRLRGTLPGITYPIQKMTGEVAGTVALVGDPDEIRPFALIVKKQIEMLLKEKQLSDSVVNRENALQNVVQEIVHFVPEKSDREMLLLRAGDLGFDPCLLYVPVTIDLYQFGRYARTLWENAKRKEESPEYVIQSVKRRFLMDIRTIFSHPRDIAAVAGNNRYIVFCAVNRETRNYREKVYKRVNENCSRMLEKLKEQGLNAAIGIGFFAEGIEQLSFSCRKAWKALLLGKKFRQGPGVYDIQDFRMEELIATTNPVVGSRFVGDVLTNLKDLPDFSDLRDTVRAWCLSNFRFVTAARTLNIHRNTLEYRLEKIHRLTGLDPKEFLKSLSLYIAFELDSYAGPGDKEAE